MKKLSKIIVFVLVLTVVLGTAAVAAESRAPRVTLRLDYSGTTAICVCTVVDGNKAIEAYLEIWDDSILIDSWEKKGESAVLFNETCTVTSGNTYTLIAYGTIDGVPFSGFSTSKKCP